MDLKIHEYPLERLSFGDDDFYDIDFWDGFEYKTAKILGSVIKQGILSGIAISLTAPSAFIVGGSPVDGSGTLTLTGAGLANQYIRGDGTLATFPTSGGGGNSVNYYLNGGTPSSVATYFQISKVPVIGTGVDFALDGNGLLSQWLTDINEPNVTEIPAGNWNFEMYFSASSAGGVPKFYIEILKYNGTTFTTIADNSLAPEPITSGTIIDLYLTSVAVPLTPLLVTDRIAIRVYIVDSTAGRTIIHHTQNSHLCQIITSFSSGLSSINGLTKQTQYLAVGTAGSDFAINSATDTHTFNLPTASASRRGALSSADWTIFNNKQDLLVSASNIKTINGTSILGSGNIVLPNKLNLLIDVAQPPIANGYLRWNDSTEFWETNQLDFKTINSQSIIGSGNLEISAPSGKFGISNSSGVYTYYATLTLAMASAVSGQVIEMFADYTETGAVSVTLKNGVNINGNGHTYFHTNATADLKTLIVADTIDTQVSIFNLIVIKSNSTGPCLYLGTNGTGSLICTGTKLINLGTGEGVGMFANAMHEIVNLYAKANTNNAIRMSGNDSRLINCYGYSSSGSGINIGNSNVINCIGISNTGTGLYATNGRITDTIGISSGTHGIIIAGGLLNNCKGFSAGGSGIHAYYCNIYSCYGYSTAGVGIHMVNQPTFASDCTGYSTTTYGIHSGEVGTKSLVNCVAISDSAIALYLYGEAINCIAICKWNNVAGHGITLNGPASILNCSIKTTNASANSIHSVSANTAKYANNSFIGATTAINANVTQGITNSTDTKGNILI